MWEWLKQLDSILRGDATRLSALREGKIEIPVKGLIVVGVALGMIYGVCMGVFALLRESGECVEQLVASTLKVPLLFFLTLIVTFPSLYVFNALVGSRLMLTSVLRLLVASLGVTLAVLASLGPVVAFFSVSTTSYSFMVLLNVAVFAVAGFLGLKFLLQTLHRLSVAWPEVAATSTSTGGQDGETGPSEKGQTKPSGALDELDGHVLGPHVRTVFRCWVIVYGLVGAQMGWVLRPFIGDPNQPFEWFRKRESHFFQSVWGALRDLF